MVLRYRYYVHRSIISRRRRDFLIEATGTSYAGKSDYVQSASMLLFRRRDRFLILSRCRWCLFKLNNKAKRLYSSSERIVWIYFDPCYISTDSPFKYWLPCEHKSGMTWEDLHSRTCVRSFLYLKMYLQYSVCLRVNFVKMEPGTLPLYSGGAHLTHPLIRTNIRLFCHKKNWQQVVKYIFIPRYKLPGTYYYRDNLSLYVFRGRNSGWDTQRNTGRVQGGGRAGYRGNYT